MQGRGVEKNKLKQPTYFGTPTTGVPSLRLLPTKLPARNKALRTMRMQNAEQWIKLGYSQSEL